MCNYLQSLEIHRKLFERKAVLSSSLGAGAVLFEDLSDMFARIKKRNRCLYKHYMNAHVIQINRVIGQKPDKPGEKHAIHKDCYGTKTRPTIIVTCPDEFTRTTGLLPPREQKQTGPVRDGIPAEHTKVTLERTVESDKPVVLDASSERGDKARKGLARAAKGPPGMKRARGWVRPTAKTKSLPSEVEDEDVASVPSAPSRSSIVVFTSALPSHPRAREGCCSVPIAAKPIGMSSSICPIRAAIWSRLRRRDLIRRSPYAYVNQHQEHIRKVAHNSSIQNSSSNYRKARTALCKASSSHARHFRPPRRAARNSSRLGAPAVRIPFSMSSAAVKSAARITLRLA